MASCFRNVCANNSQNPLILFKVTIDNVGVPFLRYSVLLFRYVRDLAREEQKVMEERRKSKVDNLYSGSYNDPTECDKRCRTASTILPLFIGLHALAATNGAST